ncbi:MAG: MoaD/ThiS family protein [Anaerolineae bacterium]|nr:MoaD/ThiS family protein [Anaerolineae bacterium]
MSSVKFTTHLQRYFPTLTETTVKAKTVAEVITAINEVYPGLAAYIVDERGRLRKHVIIFIDGEQIVDRTHLQDAVSETSQVYVFQALSGG